MGLDERTRDISLMVLAGSSLTSISEKYEISRERVRQLAVKGTKELRMNLTVPSRLWFVLLRNNICSDHDLKESIENGVIINGAGRGAAKILSNFFRREVYVNPFSNCFVFEDKRKTGKCNRKVRAAMAYYDVSMILLAPLLGMNKQSVSHYLSDELPADEQERIIKLIKEIGHDRADS